MNDSGQKKRHYWQPVSLNGLISGDKPMGLKVVLPVVAWAIIICACLLAINKLMPVDWLMPGGDKMKITTFFIIYPSLIVGLLLLFWAGFEWGFVPLFISSFALAFHSGMALSWSIVFGLSFIFGLALFGLAYQSLRVPYDLRDIKSISFFISVSFIAALASSMGAFVWSLWHGLSAYDAAIIWKGWWTGVFFQSVIIIGPLLFVFTPFVEAAKQKYYPAETSPNISVKWIYGTVISITTVLIIFIFSGKMLGQYRVNEVLDRMPHIVRGDVIGALESFEIIIWLSMGLIVITGYTAIYIIGRWNWKLKNKVEKRTEQLKQSQQNLQASLDEKKLMLKETHHRVKNNLAQVQALLQLQMMTVDDKEYSGLIKDSSTRLHSMSLIHQALYDTEKYTSISLEAYLAKLCTIIHQSFYRQNTEVELNFKLIDYTIDTRQAVSLGLLVTEILINAYKYAFEGRTEGIITVTLQLKADNKLLLSIRDNGIGIPKESLRKKNTLGMELIRKLSLQIEAQLNIETGNEGTNFSLLFEPAEPRS